MISTSATNHSSTTIINNTDASTEHQHSLLRALHWLTALLLVFAVASILLRECVDDRAIRLVLLDCHRNAGLLIIVLLLLRIIVRHTQDFLHVTTLTRLENCAAAIVHGALYLGMLSVPVLGLLLTNSQGKVLQLFALFPLPKLLGTSPALADSLSEWHETLAWIFIALIALHVLAALWHHFIRKDNVLNAMLGRSVDMTTSQEK